MGFRVIPNDVYEQVIKEIPLLQDNPNLTVMYNQIMMWVVNCYAWGHVNGVNTAQVLGVFRAAVEHHVNQFDGELGERISRQLNRTEEEAAFDINEHWEAHNAILKLATDTLSIALDGDEAYDKLMDDMGLAPGTIVSDPDGEVH